LEIVSLSIWANLDFAPLFYVFSMPGMTGVGHHT
jgi:hypothetical protein